MFKGIARTAADAMRMLAGKSGHVNIVDDEGNTRMQIVIPKRWKSAGKCPWCGEPLYCDECKDL